MQQAALSMPTAFDAKAICAEARGFRDAAFTQIHATFPCEALRRCAEGTRLCSLIRVLVQVLPEGSPLQQLGSGHSRQAARTGMLAWQEMQAGRGVLSSQLCDGTNGIADQIAIVKLPACPDAGSRPATCALLLASDSDDVVR